MAPLASESLSLILVSARTPIATTTALAPKLLSSTPIRCSACTKSADPRRTCMLEYCVKLKIRDMLVSDVSDSYEVRGRSA
jgi:hypothetical protein